MGFRGLYLTVCRLTGQRAIPSLAEVASAPGWSEEEKEDLLLSARYFSTGNFMRALLFVPFVIFGLTKSGWFIAGVFSVLITFHLVLMVMELYKLQLALRLVPDHEKPPINKGPLPPTHGDWWFRPRAFETEAFYRMIGIKFFQWITTTYIQKTSISKVDRREGKKVEFVQRPNPHDLHQFELRTRVGETTHLITALFDLMPLIHAIATKSWWWLPYILWIIYGDVGCTFLQRYHRTRVWPLLTRFRERDQRKAQESA